MTTGLREAASPSPFRVAVAGVTLLLLGVLPLLSVLFPSSTGEEGAGGVEIGIGLVMIAAGAGVIGATRWGWTLGVLVGIAALG